MIRMKVVRSLSSMKTWKFEKGGPCKKGETAAKSGCTPASGEGEKKEGKVEPKELSPRKKRAEAIKRKREQSERLEKEMEENLTSFSGNDIKPGTVFYTTGKLGVETHGRDASSKITKRTVVDVDHEEGSDIYIVSLDQKVKVPGMEGKKENLLVSLHVSDGGKGEVYAMRAIHHKRSWEVIGRDKRVKK